MSTPVKPDTLAAWKKSKTHSITLPSGTVIEIEIPNLPGLIKSGAIPNSLIDVAIGVAQGKKVTREQIVEQSDFFNKLCALTVKAPAVTEEDFASGAVPAEDAAMIVEIAIRERDLDAVGHHIGGLEKVKSFRDFRGLISYGSGDADE